MRPVSVVSSPVVLQENGFNSLYSNACYKSVTNEGYTTGSGDISQKMGRDHSPNYQP
ncbi:hypothetical protein BS47DRAFT_1351519, partial [Hydnum rufescens UP504]